MNDKPADEKKLEQTQAPPHEKKADKRSKSVYLVPYPKIVFFYPALIAAIVIAVWMSFTDRFTVSVDDKMAVAATWLFLGILSINLVIITFDFPRATSLTMFFLVAALVLATVVLSSVFPGILPTVTAVITKIHPLANATFYIIFASVMSLIFVAVLISVRFDYWEVRPNELLHHHGMLSDLKRYPAPRLRVDKEINDVFEYLLLRSGRLILQPSSERRAITLDNVPFISDKEKAITAMLGALQVQVRSDDES